MTLRSVWGACAAGLLASGCAEDALPASLDAGRDADVGVVIDAGMDAGTDASMDAAPDAASSDAASDASDDDGGVPLDGGEPDAAGTPVVPEFVALFDPDTLLTFRITIPGNSWDDIPDDSWDALMVMGHGYQHASFTHGETTFPDVGVRLKGRASYQDLTGKPGFKIKFNAFVKGTRFLGLERVTLNNMTQDPAMMRECLGYKLFRAMGLPAPLCNHVRVYVNDEYYGLYANVQTLDDNFVGWHFNPAPGNLYDITNDEYHIDIAREQEPPAQETKFVLETNKAIADTSDLTALIDAASLSSDESFVATLETVMDLDQVLAVGAVQAIIADWDGYFGAQNNYKLYHELARDRFILLPWGIAQTFGMRGYAYGGADYAIDHSGSERPNGIVLQRCLLDVACKARYTAMIEMALETFESLSLAADIDTTLALIEASALEDDRKSFTNDAFMQAIADLRDFMRMRGDRVRCELLPTAPICQ